jgi:hypothetical protein
LKRSRQGFLKRQKELARQQKRRIKEEKKAGKKDGVEGDPEAADDDEVEDGPEGLDFHAADGVLADTVDAVIPGETTVDEPEDTSEAKNEP